MEAFLRGNSTLVYFWFALDCSSRSRWVVQFGGRMQREKTSIGRVMVSLRFAYDN